MNNRGNADFHQMVADIASITRKEAKTVNLGIMYGMGRKKLAGVMDITEEDAKVLLSKYHDRVPFVKGIADMTADRASKKGVIRTWLGRKCHFDMWEPVKYGTGRPLKYKEAVHEYNGEVKRAFVYKALNKLIQGSAADMTKKVLMARMLLLKRIVMGMLTFIRR